MKSSTKGRDPFKTFLYEGVSYDDWEIPKVRTSDLMPRELIPFSKASRCKNPEGKWVHFYEDDSFIESFWNNPKKYLSLLKKFEGVISPDFSLYIDMPLREQEWNIFRGKLLASWLVQNGVEVIPNVRWGSNQTYNLACLGVEHGKTIAVGTHGCINSVAEKIIFIQGFEHAIFQLHPKDVIVHGNAPDKIFGIARMYGVEIHQFDSQIKLAHKRGR